MMPLDFHKIMLNALAIAEHSLFIELELLTYLAYKIVTENKSQGNRRDVLVNGWGLVYVHFALTFRLIPHNPTRK